MGKCKGWQSTADQCIFIEGNKERTSTIKKIPGKTMPSKEDCSHVTQKKQ